MAIDPSLITTVQVSELPSSIPDSESLLAHQIGDVLYKMSLDQLISYIGSRSSANPYELKYIVAPDIAYLNSNFNMAPGEVQGIGLENGLWNGWAICNGNNGTENLDGVTLIGYGANNNVISLFLGEKTHTLTIPEMPLHGHAMTNVGNVNDAKNENVNRAPMTARWDTGSGTALRGEVLGTGGNVPHNNMQPSMVVLIIMKLP